MDAAFEIISEFLLNFVRRDTIQDDLCSILLNPVASFQNGGSLNF
jgi:hypothetical protein